MLKINELKRIHLGVQGENDARTIEIDVTEWMKSYPAGTVSVWNKRNGETINYTPTGIEYDADEKILSWTPSGVDTFYAGAGWCGIILTENGVVKKSRDIETFVTASESDIPGSDANAFDYNRASNKPKLNGVEIQGEKDLKTLGAFDDTNMSSTTKTISAAKIKEELDKKIDKANIENDLTGTAEGKVLDARQGKILKDQVDGKIDKPSGVAAGKFMQTDNDGKEFWGNPADAAVIAQDVASWLSEHTSGGETLIADDTFTIPGAAAESVAVGALKSAINELDEETRNLWINPIYNANGITITQNEDGSVHLSGTASTALFIDYYLDEDLTLTSCTFSIKRTGTVGNKINAIIRNAGNTTPQSLPLETTDTFACMRVTNYSAHRFEIVVREGTYNCDLYIQLEDGKSATDFIPHITAKDFISRESIQKLGNYFGKTRNLWLNPIFRSGEIAITQNADGSVHVSGTPTSDTYIDVEYPAPLPSDNYAFSCEKKGTATGKIYIAIRNAGNTNPQIIAIESDYDYGNMLISSYEPSLCQIILFANKSYNCDLYIQLEKGTSVTDYIPNFTSVDFVARKAAENNGISDVNVLTETAKNYVPIIVISNKSIVTKWGNSSGVITHDDDVIGYEIAVAKSGGFMTETFLVSDMPSTDFRVTFGLTLTNGTVRVFVYGKNANNDDVAYLIGIVSASNDHVSIDVDAAYLDVYTTVDITKPMRILISSGGDEISKFTVSGLEVNSNIVVTDYIENYGQDTVANILKKINNDNGSISAEQQIQYYFSPNGTKYLATISNDGSMRGIKAIPVKSIFIGNSLLMGWSTFGMAASDSDHDYYHYVTQRIAELNPSATYNHISNGNLEHSTNNTDFTAAWAVITPYLTSDVELICIQLGDNVNTDAKKAQFELTSFNAMVDWIHTNCPNARLVWVGTWYQSIYEWLKKACWKKGVQFIDIFDLSVAENKAAIGDVVQRTEDRTQTLTGTYTVSGSSLLLSVTISGDSYSITIPSYTSVEDNGNGTFTMVAPYTVIDSVGIASHPNDAGMLAIANRICKKLDFIYEEGDITDD